MRAHACTRGAGNDCTARFSIVYYLTLAPVIGRLSASVSALSAIIQCA